MKASKTLRRPANWQDFESLCKKLWGEIWDCPEIKKNGRSGQAQHGVDVYGIPHGDTQYYGIQCKGKEEYSNKQFTKREIDREIAKAKKFRPALKKLYFATTAQKDVKIESYVREKNVAHITSGIFEVHIYSWEDIVEMIDENRHTHNWYVNNQNFKTENNVSITFDNGKNEITRTPKFNRRVTSYVNKSPAQPSPNFIRRYNGRQLDMLPPIVGMTRSYYTEINLSYFDFNIKMQNTGTAPIEQFKILLHFEGDILEIDDTNESRKGYPAVPDLNLSSDIEINRRNKNVVCETKKGILVSEDIHTFDRIFIKPSPKQGVIKINWKLISINLKKEGILTIKVEPQILRQVSYISIVDSKEVREELGEVEDDIIKTDN